MGQEKVTVFYVQAKQGRNSVENDQTDRWKDKQTDSRQAGSRQTDGWMDIQTYRQTDRQMDRLTD